MDKELKDQTISELELGSGSVLPERQNVPQAYKWKINDIYSDEPAWESDFKTIKERINEIPAYADVWAAERRHCSNVLSCATNSL